MAKDNTDALIRSAIEADIEGIRAVVNAYAAQNLMLPRTVEQVRYVLPHFLVAEHEGQIVGCGSLVELTPRLTELRSLAVSPEWRGTGLGRRLVEALVARAREAGYQQLCVLTLVEDFFNHLGFATVDRWTISPKIWHECVYCPKFNACDEIAMTMDLVETAPEAAQVEFDLLLWRRPRVGTTANCEIAVEVDR